MNPERQKTLSLILLNNRFHEYFFEKKTDKENVDRVGSRNGLTGVIP